MHIVIWTFIPYALLNIAAQVQASTINTELQSPNEKFNAWKEKVKEAKEAEKNTVEAPPIAEFKDPKAKGGAGGDNKFNKETTLRKPNVPGRTPAKGGTNLKTLTSDKPQPPDFKKPSPGVKQPLAGARRPSVDPKQKARRTAHRYSLVSLNKGAAKLNAFVKGVSSMGKLRSLKLQTLSLKYSAEQDLLFLMVTVFGPRKYLVFQMKDGNFEPCSSEYCQKTMDIEADKAQEKKKHRYARNRAVSNKARGTSDTQNKNLQAKPNTSVMKGAGRKKDLVGGNDILAKENTQKADIKKKPTPNVMNGTGRVKDPMANKVTPKKEFSDGWGADDGAGGWEADTPIIPKKLQAAKPAPGLKQGSKIEEQTNALKEL